MREIVALFDRIAAIERVLHSLARHGTVHEVDAKKQKCRVRLGGTDEKPFLSGWIPYAQMAGAFKAHIPVSKGQNVTLFSQAGDYRQSVAVPFTWSDENKSPSESADENVITFGKLRVTIKGEEATIAMGDKASIKIEPGKITATVDHSTHVIEAEKISSSSKEQVHAVDGKSFKVTGSIKATKTIQSDVGVKAPIIGGVAGDPPDAD